MVDNKFDRWWFGIVSVIWNLLKIFIIVCVFFGVFVKFVNCYDNRE